MPIHETSLAETHTNQHFQPSEDTVISVRNIGKMYRIYNKPVDRLKQMFLWRTGRSYGQEFWALRNISFDIKKGEAIAILGRNGSGKSTLLQIIAQILAPSEGQINVYGRVAALLELGSGFNPEFTGRENVFLNGSILGLSRQEIEQRFEDIAAFADIGEFIDQPTKTYSSGMVLRLAFAVQAHVEPAILIVDEALAVGDVYFQHKCMRHIKQMIDQGTTLLLVTHDTVTVKRYCRRALWLDSGHVQSTGDAGVVAEQYLAFMRMREVQDWVTTPLLDDTVHMMASHLALPQSGNTIERPLVSHTINLNNEDLFERGTWSLEYHTVTQNAVRVTTDPQALASFRYYGNSLILQFVCGPSVSAVQVYIDGIAQGVELVAADWSIKSFQLNSPMGEHLIQIMPIMHQGYDKVIWLGGNVLENVNMEWRADPLLNQHSGQIERYGNRKALLTAVELLDANTLEQINEIQFGQRVRLRLHAKRLQVAGPRLEFSYIIRDRNRIDLFGTTTIDEHIRLDQHAERFVVEFSFDIRLGPGSYSILVAFVECSEDLSQRIPMDQIDMALVFTVTFDTQRPVWYIFHEPVISQVTQYPPE